MYLSILLSLVGVAFLATLGEARPMQECCELLSTAFPNDVFGRTEPQWQSGRTNFWSATEHLTPTCVFFPDTTEKVAQAVRLFSREKCRFSIKGGGHSAIPGAANINDGIMMAMQQMNASVVNTEASHVTIGAGARFGSVYQACQPFGLVPVVGRYETVGLGLAVGAGISFLSNEVGFVVDNVLNYEVVLANGTIVNANGTSHADLFRALKGGNNNFGVVTRYTIRAFPTGGSMYGGVVYYNETFLDQATDVVWDYHIRQSNVDPKTHALPQYGYNGTTNETTSFNLITYNAPVNELPEVMRGWTDVPHYQSTLRNRNYSDLAIEVNDGYPNGQVQEQRVFTVYADEQLYKDLIYNYRRWLQQYREIPGFYGLHVVMPITPLQIAQGPPNGGNSLGLENINSTLGVMYFGVTFENMSDAPYVLPAHDAFVQSQIDLADSRGLLHRYIMCTYSGYNQRVMASYGQASLHRMRAVAEAYDPNGVFQSLVPGGQKLSATP